MKRMVMGMALGLALVALPQAARAQHHEHAAPKSKPAAQAQVENPARALMAMRAELKLTQDQVGKLEAIALRMDAHHKSMGKAHGDAVKRESAESTDQIHKDFLAIFTKDQLPKVKEVMAAHHGGAHPEKH